MAPRHNLAPDDPRHGTTNGYNNCGCRCQPCKSAWARWHIQYMNNHPEQREKQRAYMREYNARQRAERKIKLNVPVLEAP